MIEYKIPHFLFGVSRQPENQRQPGTVYEQINGYSNISEGLKKRRGTYFEGEFNLSNPSEVYKIHWINSTDETFVAFFCNNATTPLQIFKLSDPSTAMTINYDLTASEGADYTANKKNYLTKDAKSAGNSISVLDDLRVLSIFDSTFIANKKMVCGLIGTADGSTNNAPSNAAYGDSGDGTYGITANTSVYPSFNDLPMRVQGTNDNVNADDVTAGDYYKTLQSTVTNPAGVYQVTASSTSGSQAANTALYELQITDYDNSLIDYETMPLQLVYNAATDDFDVKYPAWSHRLTGDPETNPGPSFIGRSIDDIVFHQNRLWICADEFIVSSRASDYFNFWPYDIGNQVPSDPIDETIADEGLNKIIYAVPYSRTLVLFTEGGRQFEVRSTGGMAPDTVTIIPTTSYFVSRTLRPTFLGNNLYFLSDFDNYGQLYEYYYIDNAASNVAASVTDHIPNYLPSGLSLVSGDINNGIMLFSDRATQSVYCYISRWQGDQKVINSFSRWGFPDTDFNIQSHSYVDSAFYFVLKNTDNTWIVLSLDTVNKPKLGDIPYEESLDYLERFSSGGSYDSGSNRTTFTMSIDLNPSVTEDNIVVLVENRDTYVGFSLEVLNVDTVGGVTTVEVNGDWTSYDVAIGIKFDFEVDLNYVYIRDQDNTTVTGNFTMKQLILFVKDTIQYSVEVDTIGRDTSFSYDYSIVRLDASAQMWDAIPMAETQRTQNIVYGQGRTSRIKIKDTSEFPITLVEGQIRGVFSKTLGNR